MFVFNVKITKCWKYNRAVWPPPKTKTRSSHNVEAVQQWARYRLYRNQPLSPHFVWVIARSDTGSCLTTHARYHWSSTTTSAPITKKRMKQQRVVGYAPTCWGTDRTYETACGDDLRFSATSICLTAHLYRRLVPYCVRPRHSHDDRTKRKETWNAIHHTPIVIAISGTLSMHLHIISSPFVTSS